MAQFWSEVFNGTVGGRPVVVRVYDNSESLAYQVETNYNMDQIIGDAGRGGGFVSKDEKMNIDGETVDELERNLIVEGNFAEATAKEIVSHISIS